MAGGNVLGYSAGSYTHLYWIAPFTKTDACDIFCANLKICFFISVALLISIMLLAVWAVSEDPYVPEAAVEDGATGKQQMVAALKELSKPIWILLLLGAQLYNRGVRAGALGLMLNSVVFGLASLCIEHLARWVCGVKRLWGCMNFLLAVCLAMTLVVTHMARSEPEFAKATPKTGIVGLALATFAVLGAPLAVMTFSVPCALASIFCNNSRAGQGLSLGVLNLAVVIPQIVVSLLSGPWDSLKGGGNMPAFAVGAVAAVVSGIIAFTMLPSPPLDVLATASGGGGMH
ncbi:putative MFS transporter superfamily [Helianthus annuus]|nr:putative MFS transporter superfamily [Helianthus annuus]KAJ0955466.1 putative MFS transporter superfamily [Helianthus annuus]